MASRQQIKQWLKEAEAADAAFMIVAWDSFGRADGDYPIFVERGVDPETRRPVNGDRVMECYDLSLSIQDQLNERWANHWGATKQGTGKG